MFTVAKTSGQLTARRLFGVVALATALFMTVAPAAGAAPAVNGSTDDTLQPALVTTIAGTKRADGSSPLSSCAITLYGYTGYRICEFDYSYINWGNGNVEWFVVGTNYAIYHIWLNSGGWHSLGGQADRQTPNGAYAYLFGVSTWGTNDLFYCRDWPWSSGWYRC
jgi:hypothetical protein